MGKLVNLQHAKLLFGISQHQPVQPKRGELPPDCSAELETVPKQKVGLVDKYLEASVERARTWIATQVTFLNFESKQPALKSLFELHTGAVSKQPASY